MQSRNITARFDYFICIHPDCVCVRSVVSNATARAALKCYYYMIYSHGFLIVSVCPDAVVVVVV